jgi:cyclopropane fatty-acyl-phospholipid synthase-like methyltransferase
MDSHCVYDPAFFEMLRHTSLSSASELVPFVYEWIKPRSVVDVGCGEGTWLEMFAAHGCRVVGIDSDWVPRGRLRIAQEQFIAHDLAQSLPESLYSCPFDLVVSLEVAEHLPEARADGFVHDLARLGSYVMFSAATPGQGGYGHINEQPHEYWIERFQDLGFAHTALLQRRFEHNEAVASWYRANVFIFVKV